MALWVAFLPVLVFGQVSMSVSDEGTLESGSSLSAVLTLLSTPVSQLSQSAYITRKTLSPLFPTVSAIFNSSSSSLFFQDSACEDWETKRTIFPCEKPSGNASFQEAESRSILSVLASSHLIPKSVYSLYLQDLRYSEFQPTSTVVLGGFDLQTYAIESNFHYFPARNRAGNWQFPLHSVSLESLHIPSSQSHLRLDPTTDYILGPKKSVSAIKQRLGNHRMCEERGGDFLCECGLRVPVSSYPGLRFTLGKETEELTIAPEFYWKRIGDNQCVFLIKPDLNDFWTFGKPFFRQFYVIFDLETEEVGLARSVNWEKGRLNWALPIFAVGLFLLCAFCGTKLRSKRKKSDLLLEQDYLNMR